MASIAGALAGIFGSLGTVGTAALAGGALSAAGSIAGASIGAGAAKTAAQQQANAEEQALQFQEQVYGNQQANQAPYVQLGTSSLASLEKGLSSGQFSLPSAPTAFSTPTLAQAENQPGYQFALQQGEKGILTGASATGGNISGGTLKSLDQYAQNSAETNYNNVFSQALSGYNANLQGYAAQLAGQQQAFSQALAPVQIGESAVSGINNTGTQVAQNAGQLLSNIGTAQAGGTIGAANATTAGITGATNSASQAIQLAALLKSLGLGSVGPSIGNNPGGTYGTLSQGTQTPTLINSDPDYLNSQINYGAAGSPYNPGGTA